MEETRSAWSSEDEHVRNWQGAAGCLLVGSLVWWIGRFRVTALRSVLHEVRQPSAHRLPAS